MSFMLNTVKAVVLTVLSVLRAILCCCRRNKTRGGISELDRSAVSDHFRCTCEYETISV